MNVAAPETVVKEKHCVWESMPYQSPYLIVKSVVSYPAPSTKVKGWSGKDLSY